MWMPRAKRPIRTFHSHRNVQTPPCLPFQTKHIPLPHRSRQPSRAAKKSSGQGLSCIDSIRASIVAWVHLRGRHMPLGEDAIPVSRLLDLSDPPLTDTNSPV